PAMLAPEIRTVRGRVGLGGAAVAPVTPVVAVTPDMAVVAVVVGAAGVVVFASCAIGRSPCVGLVWCGTAW
ncbi:hypothetical protein ACFXO2_05150, partial [Streptomyces sp. NPDC059152]|uniref:hypothetical protein n=1 Tax=Streptomyces sp. NPDC059152 TaxID=3346742 RepID=UPI0036A0D3EB